MNNSMNEDYRSLPDSVNDRGSLRRSTITNATRDSMLSKYSTTVSSYHYKEKKALLSKIETLEKKVQDLETENREGRENLEFIGIERDCFSDTIRDLEEQLKEEHAHRIREVNQLTVQNQQMHESVQSHTTEMKQLKESLATKEAMNDRLMKEQDDKLAQLQHVIECWSEIDSALVSALSTNPTLSLRPKDEGSLIQSMRKRLLPVKQMKEEINRLRDEVASAIQENVTLMSQVKQCFEYEKQKDLELNLREELREERDRCNLLMDELDSLKDQLRLSEVVSSDLRNQMKESTPTPSINSMFPSTNEFLLNSDQPMSSRQEVKTLRELVTSREEMVQKLNDKYLRHRQVWEENEKRANEEIKKLDDIIDRVVLTLSNCSQFVIDCPPLKMLLNDLTKDQEPHIISSLPSTFV